MSRILLVMLLFCAPLMAAVGSGADELSALLKKGAAAMAANNADQARIAFLKASEIAPENPAAYSNLGLLEMRIGNFEAAEKYLKKAVRVAPELASAWLTLGVLQCARDQLDAALAALSQAVLLEPKNPKARNYLGVTISRKGWLSGADSEFRKAIELDPDYAEAHFNLALCSLQQNPPLLELARRHYQQALGLGAKPDPLVEKRLNQANN